MFYFDSLEVTDIPYYKHAVLDLNYVGLTTIRGHNRNAIRAKHRANAAGKSLIVSTIPNLAFNSHPVLVELGSRTSGLKTSLLPVETSRISLKCHTPDDGKLQSYLLSKHGKKGGGYDYDVTKNGKELGYMRKGVAEELISSIFPFSEEEFYSHTYLDRNRQDPLKVGSAAARTRYFSSICRLDGFDYVKEQCDAMRKELRDEQIRLEELKARASDLRTEISEEKSSAVLKKQLAEHSGLVASLKAKADRLYAQQSDLKFYEANLKTMNKVQLAFGSLGGLSERVVKLKAQIVVLEKKIERLREYLTYKKELAQYTDKRKHLRGKLGKYRGKRNTLTARVEKQAARRRLLERQLDSARDTVRKARQQIDRLPKLKIDKGVEAKAAKLMRKKNLKFRALLVYMQEALSGVSTNLDTTRRLLKMMDKLKPGEDCFVCGTNVRHSHKTGLLKVLEHRERELKKRSKFLTKIVEDLGALGEAQMVAKEKVDLEEQLKAPVADTLALAARLEKLGTGEKERRLLLLIEKYQDLDKPVWKGLVPKGSISAKLITVKKLLASCALVQTFYPVAKRMKTLRTRYKERLPEGVDKQYERVRAKLEKSTQMVARLEPLLVNLLRRKTELKDVEEKISKKELKLRDLPILAMLSDLYSSKGLKISRLQERADMMAQTMNQNAGLLYHEEMRFNFDITPGKFDIVATRGRGKTSKSSDIRFLSGSESSAFSLLRLWGSLLVSPSRMRSNLLVLDEMDSGLDNEGRQLFIQEFLPALNTIVPHIIVVTPLDDEYPGSRAFTAVKQGNETKLVAVQPTH